MPLQSELLRHRWTIIYQYYFSLNQLATIYKKLNLSCLLTSSIYIPKFFGGYKCIVPFLIDISIFPKDMINPHKTQSNKNSTYEKINLLAFSEEMIVIPIVHHHLSFRIYLYKKVVFTTINIWHKKRTEFWHPVLSQH